MLSSDSPLTDERADAFGYGPFAGHVARALTTLAPIEGLAVAIHGPWGCGKSTLLNFVRKELDALPAEQRPIVLPFNPWWFSGSEDLVGHFFRELLARLDARDARTKRIRERIADFAEVAAAAPVPYIGSIKILKLLAPKAQSVHRLRDALDECLRESGRRIVVVIDDIDRLTADEIRQLFRVVRAVLNLPHITYLLAYDCDRVAESLGEGDLLSGYSYLEKIVQVPFDLPVPDRTALSAYFTTRLNHVVADVPEVDFDDVRWANVFVEGIDTFLGSPRSAIRLVNALSLTLPAVRGEVDVIDFIALETLRLHAPRAYDFVRHNPRLFAGAASTMGEGVVESERVQVAHALTLVAPGRQAALKSILLNVFPRLHSLFGNTHYGSDHEARWRRERRAASSDHLGIYFRLAVPLGAFSAAEMQRAIVLMADAEQFRDYLRSLVTVVQRPGVTRARAFLARLEDYTAEGIPQDRVRPSLRALLAAGDDLLRAEPDRESMFEFGMSVQLPRVLLRLLARLPAGERLGALEDLAAESAVATLVDVAQSMEAQHDPRRDPQVRLDPLLSAEESRVLRVRALERVRSAAASGELAEAPGLPSLLRQWEQWSSTEEMRNWLNQQLASIDFFARFMAQFVQVTMSWGLSDRAARRSKGVDLKWLARFIEPAEAAMRATEALKQVSDPRLREALTLVRDTVAGIIPSHGDNG